jgi:hypothetical protein
VLHDGNDGQGRLMLIVNLEIEAEMIFEVDAGFDRDFKRRINAIVNADGDANADTDICGYEE